MHDYGMVNLNQSPEERRLKYAFAKWAGCTASEANWLRDTEWSKLAGNLELRIVNTANVGAMKELCQIGYEMFKEEHNTQRRERYGT
jgi:hypothetical protein